MRPAADTSVALEQFLFLCVGWISVLSKRLFRNPTRKNASEAALHNHKLVHYGRPPRIVLLPAMRSASQDRDNARSNPPRAGGAASLPRPGMATGYGPLPPLTSPPHQLSATSSAVELPV